MAANKKTKRTAHLKAVPTGSGPAAAAKRKTTDDDGIPGLTPANGDESGEFVTDALVDLGYVTSERVERAVSEARNAGRPPEELLLEEGIIDSDQLSRAVAERYGLDHLDLGEYHVDMAAANLVPVSSARKNDALPVGYFDKETLLVAMADPANVVAVDDIQVATGLDCRVAVAAAEDIEALIGRLNTLQNAVSEAIDEDEEDEGQGAAELSELRASPEDAPVIKLVYSVLGQAVNEGASDVHFEPGEDEMRVRFRVDGILYEAARVPKRMSQAVISRIKIMASMDIAEKRAPQDGRVSVTVEERRVDLRVTTLPTQRGEGIAVRILDKDATLRTLDDLGLDGKGRKRFEEAFHQAYGAVVVTGPTGSGKSTTLYAALEVLNQIEKNIITIEDPVEYRLTGINQMGVNRKANLDFANGLRSILRADPDIIMVGEIRDSETARIAIEAALTGHMVLTTLHTNDAPGAVTRLAKMGIESFLTASAVDCVVAQRLARKLCPNCKQRAAIPKRVLEESGFKVRAGIEAYEPVGCSRCNKTGYKGRMGIFSVMTVSDTIKDLVVNLAPEAELATQAAAEGMLTLREDGLAKVRTGLTSIEEVVRVTS
jgi:type IV pilus assembly protein PilB